jgi:hypothetical protein
MARRRAHQLRFVERLDFLRRIADSKHCRLQEPGKRQVQVLLDVLKAGGLTVEQKPNLARLLV